MLAKFIPVLLVICALAVACSDDDSDNPTNPGNQLSSEDAILPLAAGNYWVLRSTETLNDTSVSVDVDTFRVTGPEVKYNDESWFDLSYNQYSSQPMRNGAGGTMIWAKNRQSVMYPYPAAVGDTVDAMTGMGGLTVTVMAIAEVVTVPAGTFTCYKYYYEDPASNETFTDYLSPRVGIVKVEYYNENNSPQYPNGHKVETLVELMEYDVK